MEQRWAHDECIASELFARVHRVASLLKLWLLGTHRGAPSEEHMDYYLDEFTFRFNRRRSRSRGQLVQILLEQPVEIEPVPYRSLIIPDKKAGNGDHKILGSPE